jgi:hypothetical protein
MKFQIAAERHKRQLVAARQKEVVHTAFAAAGDIAQRFGIVRPSNSS